MEALGGALDLIGARGIPTWYPWAAAARGYALALSGRAAEAVPLIEGALERAVSLPFLFGHSQWVSWLAHASLLAGRLDAAVRLGHEGLRLSRERGEQGYEAWGLHILAAITRAAAAGSPKSSAGSPSAAAAREAGALDLEALALATRLGMRPLAARTHLALGEAYRHCGDESRAEEHLAPGR